MKNFYQILGVNSDAPTAVIKAAYRALAQMYHPDKFAGDKLEATSKMAELNVAYETLSDASKRAAYDQDLSSKSFHEHTQRATRDSRSELDPWKIASRVYPKIEVFFRELQMVNARLAEDYKAYLLESKHFKDAENIAFGMLDLFLSKYFGENPEIKAFAIQIIRSVNKSMARYLNDVVAILGPSATIDAIRDLFIEKFPHHMKNTVKFGISPYDIERIKKGQLPIHDAKRLILSLGGKIKQQDNGLFSATVNGFSETSMSENYLRSRFLQDALVSKDR